MAKGRIKNVDVTVETDKSKVTFNKEGEKVNISIDTPKVDVEFNREDKDSKEFNLDTKNLDIHVKQEGDEITTEVQAKSGFLTKLGNLIGKIFTKRFKRK
jgi:hypothetical protein